MFVKKIVYILLFITSLHAQDFTGIRIYINPGHGGHDSNDRYIAATGFWESDGNLSKGLFLKEILDGFGATTQISRTTNNSTDDLGLSVISARANAFDADYFQSIHSNGWKGNSNSTLILFQGGDNSPTYTGAKIMGNYLANEIYKAHRTTNKSNRGDADFYGTGQPYLGVLKGLSMPGTLSEGSFHDYIPESWRLRNPAYLKHEAWAITKAFINYFNLPNLTYGEIAGILRDPFDIVNYNYINSSDSKKPLNFVRATLIPGNKLYLGDALNNGFFMFDKVTPGTYDVILEAEDYEKDTLRSIVVTANNTTFADKFLTPAPNYSPPTVNSFSPNSSENVRLDSDIIFEFNVKMNRISVEQSFSISPNVSGSFTWESNDRKLIFSPNEFLKGGSTYQIKINTFAKSFYNVFIEEQFNHTFNTRSALSLINTYPNQNETDISTTVKLVFTFDAPINEFSLGGQILFQEMNSTNVGLFIDEVDYLNGKIIFEPQKPLENNKSYQVKLLSGIKDSDGSNLSTDTTIVFTTESKTVIEGVVINDFEDIGTWWQPEESGSTVGINTDLTSFSISTKKEVDGESSGLLSYEFSNDSLGLCRLYNSNEFDISSNVNDNFGLWVFGDLSDNFLEYWFRQNDETNLAKIIDTINWSGWKFKKNDLSDYSNLKFHSIVISQNKLGEKSGHLYFDKMKYNVITDLKNETNEIPTHFKLEQNYPNPFNPSTTIKYSIPIVATQHAVSLQIKVYDILGKEVSTLVNEVKQSGNYEITFDASKLTSGVYYYQLISGDFIETKKMLLLK